jgi:hypothetical protein
LQFQNTTDGTTDDDESAISTDISEADTDFNIPSAEAFQSTSSLITTEIARGSNSLGIEEDKPIFQNARKRALSGQQIQAEKLMRTTKRKLSELSVGNNVIITDISEADTDFNIPSAEAFQSTSSLGTTEIAPNSEETPVVQILNPHQFLGLYLLS